MYSPLSYFIAKNMIEMPAIALGPMLTLLIIYWGVEYINFFKIYLVMFLVAHTAVGIGLLISSFAPNVTTATSIAPLFTMPMILFGGFISNTNTTPAWLGWI